MSGNEISPILEIGQHFSGLPLQSTYDEYNGCEASVARCRHGQDCECRQNRELDFVAQTEANLYILNKNLDDSVKNNSNEMSPSRIEVVKAEDEVEIVSDGKNNENGETSKAASRIEVVKAEDEVEIVSDGKNNGNGETSKVASRIEVVKAEDEVEIVSDGKNNGNGETSKVASRIEVVKAEDEVEFVSDGKNNGNGETSKASVSERRNNGNGDRLETVIDPAIFQVDRNQIEKVELCDHAAELQTLGLSVYDQDTLEKGILQQVDDALEQLDHQLLEQQMKAMADDIKTCSQHLKKSGHLLKALEMTGVVGRRQAVSVRKDVEARYKQLTSLKARASALQQKYDGINLSATAENEDKVSATTITTATAVSGKKIQEQESEKERKIRLGEMTPFGNVLDNKSPSHSKSREGLTEFEKYLQNQEELQKQKHDIIKRKKVIKNDDEDHVQDIYEDTGKDKQKRKMKSPLKKRILLPKKRQKKEKLGTHSSDDWCDQKQKPGKLLSEQTAVEDSEGSEYLPSPSELGESDKEEKNRPVKLTPKKKVTPVKRRQYRNQDPEEWSTDDSDWDYSDDESRAKRRKSTKKEIDDGNMDDYYERLKMWEEKKAKEGEPEETCYHELEGGYKLPKDLWLKLYNYQKVGVQWLWELNQQKCGGILGDEMGLGKTIQIIAFLAGLSCSKLLSRHGNFRGLGPCLIVCPTTVMHQWVREFHVWWPHFRVAVLHESGSFTGKRESLIGQMNHVECILVASYVGAVQHQKALLAKDWHYVILDEGHKIRNPDAQVTLAVKQFRTPHRLILSGSPMQNNLKELWSLFDFIFPGKLGTLPVFLAQMAVPITQGGYANASEVQVATAYRCATVLRDTISPYLLRRMKTDVKAHISLPPKNEQVLFCRLTEEQRTLYKSYLDSGEVERILQGRFQVFVGLIALRKICNHPDLYSGGPKLLRGEREEDLPEESRYGYWRRSGKMLVVDSLLSIWQKQGHRVLLFTQGQQMLCILEAFIQKKGYKYLKLDGGTCIGSRQPLINKFNEDASYFILLLTTRVGGLGVNLTGADRVVIYDPDWNPATDTQARERAWRIGQQKHVTIYRLVTAGTIEEKVYHRQIFKQFLCNKVLRDPRQRRFFKSNDLMELFTLAESERTTETAAIFAGTGSEVKMNYKKSKSSNKEKVQPKKNRNSPLKDITFSTSKLERMKRLAQLLSKQISTIKTPESSNISGSCELEKKKGESDSDVVQLQCTYSTNYEVATSVTKKEVTELNTQSERVDDCDTSEKKVVKELFPIQIRNNENGEIDSTKQIIQKCTVTKEMTVENNLPSTENVAKQNSELKKKSHRDVDISHDHSNKHHHRKKRKHRREKGAMFEGERVPFLVKQRHAKEDGHHSADQAEQSSVQHDDYVLQKLFKKTGIQTAMRHDTIMEGGDADYALVEGEAQRVAKEAVLALKVSRRQCWQAETGVPSWTGQSGALRSSNNTRPIFGKKKSVIQSPTKIPENKLTKSTTPNVSSEEPMSSSELLSRMRTRNRLLEPLEEPEPGQNENGEQEDNPADNIPQPTTSSIQEEHTELLTDIRNFVAFGASVDGRASTQEVLARFSARLPPGSSPLFKFMLSEVCEFCRMPSGEGMWRLRNEFRW